jgi:hypothetical protein
VTQPHALVEVATIAAQAGFWAAAMFPPVTALYWPWWQHQWGWTIISLDFSLALALVGDVLVIEFGMVPGSTPGHIFAWVETIALCLIPVIIVWRAVLTFVTQRRGARQDRSLTPPEGIPAAD